MASSSPAASVRRPAGALSAAAAAAAARRKTSAKRGGASRPLHKRCGAALARLYYTMYSRASRGSRTLPLADWMWCSKCATPVRMVQCDVRAARKGAARGRRRSGAGGGGGRG